MRRNILILACAAIAVASAGMFFYRAQPATVVNTPTFMDRAAGEAMLPPDSREELLRRVQYGADGFTRQRLVVYFRNGETGVTVYNADRSLDVYRYHPSATEIDWRAAKLSEKGLKVLLRIASNGKLVTEERRWDVDGKLKRIGLRTPAGAFQVRAFFGDGTELAEESIFNVYGSLESQLTYWPNGNARIVLKRTLNTRDWASFAEDGKKIAWSKTEGSIERGEFFFDDGKTVQMRYVKETAWTYYSGSSSVKVSYFGRDSTQIQSRVYRRGSLTVSVPKNGNTPEFSQEWKVVDGKRMGADYVASDNFSLEKVSISRFDGLTDVTLFVTNGKVTMVRGDRKLADGGRESVFRNYRVNGTLEKETSRSASGVVTERTFPEDSGRKFVGPGVFFDRPPYDSPPVAPDETTFSGGYR